MAKSSKSSKSKSSKSTPKGDRPMPTKSEIEAIRSAPERGDLVRKYRLTPADRRRLGILGPLFAALLAVGAASGCTAAQRAEARPQIRELACDAAVPLSQGLADYVADYCGGVPSGGLTSGGER